MKTRIYGLMLLALVWGGLQLHGVFTNDSWVDEITTRYRVAGYGKTWPWADGSDVATISQVTQVPGSAAKVLDELDHTGIHPPLYYMARLFAGPLFGNGLLGARLFAVLFFLASIWFVWRFVRRLDLPAIVPEARLENSGALAATIFYAFASVPFAMAQDGRYYSFTLCLIAACLWLAMRIAKCSEPQLRDSLLFGLTAGMLAATHYIPLPLGFAIALYALVCLWRQTGSVAGWVRHAAAMGLAALPMLLVSAHTFLMQSQAGGRPVQLAGFPGFLSQTAHALYSLPKVVLAEPLDLTLGRVQGMVLLAVMLMAGIMLLDRRHRPGAGLVLGLIAVQLAAMVLLAWGLDKRLAQSIRYNALLMPLLAPVLVYAAAGAARLVRQPMVAGVLCAGLLALQVGRAAIGNTVDGWARPEAASLPIVAYMKTQAGGQPLYVDMRPRNNFMPAMLLHDLNAAGVQAPVLPFEALEDHQAAPVLVVRIAGFVPEQDHRVCAPVAAREGLVLMRCAEMAPVLGMLQQ